MQLQLIKAAFWGITALLAVAIAGLIGYYQGFARALGISDLERTIPLLIADGVQMIRDLPGHVFNAGLTGTSEWVIAVASLILAAGFLTIALLAPKPARVQMVTESARSINSKTPQRRPDTPPDLKVVTRQAYNLTLPGTASSVDLDLPHYSNLARVMASLGGTLVLCIAAAQITWTVYRHHYLGAVSILDPQTNISTWIDAARVAAGIDTIVLSAGVLWLLFALRIPEIFGWLHRLGLVALGTTVAIAFAACAISVGTVSQINTRRPVVVLADTETVERNPEYSRPLTELMNLDTSAGGFPASADADADDPAIAQPEMFRVFTPQLALIVGRSASHLVLLRADGRTVLLPNNQTMKISERQTIREFVRTNRPRTSDSATPADG